MDEAYEKGQHHLLEAWEHLEKAEEILASDFPTFVASLKELNSVVLSFRKGLDAIHEADDILAALPPIERKD